MPATAPAETSPAAQSWPITLNANATGALRNVSTSSGGMIVVPASASGFER